MIKASDRESTNEKESYCDDDGSPANSHEKDAQATGMEKQKRNAAIQFHALGQTADVIHTLGEIV